jgi:hypothetical protein
MAEFEIFACMAALRGNTTDYLSEPNDKKLSTCQRCQRSCQPSSLTTHTDSNSAFMIGHNDTVHLLSFHPTTFPDVLTGKKIHEIW